MTETCKANGIHEFSRTRGGWMKMVEGIDKSKKGGYSFIGDNFFKVGNFKTNLPNGIYLDQSTSVENGNKILTMNLFKIENGTVELLDSVPKANGWAEDLWSKVDGYFHQQTEITSQDIVNTITDITTDAGILEDVILKLQEKLSEGKHREFKNWYEVKSYLSDMECFTLPIATIEKYVIPKYHTEDTYIFKCDELSYQYRRYITAFANLIAEKPITEETPIDYRKITPTTFRSDFFKNEIKNADAQYLARTTPNNTGYHNNITVTIFYFQDGILCIREFRYFFDPYKANQTGDEFIQPQ